VERLMEDYRHLWGRCELQGVRLAMRRYLGEEFVQLERLDEMTREGGMVAMILLGITKDIQQQEEDGPEPFL
jgi:hypothetical protein